MKKRHPVSTLCFTALILFMAGSVFAARIKGKVAVSAADHDQVCSAISVLADADPEIPCLLDSGITAIVVVDIEKKARIREGQDIILKAKGTHKVMAKAYRVFPAGAAAAEIFTAVEKNGMVALKDSGGCIILIIPEKPFDPEKDSPVTIKTKQKQAVEGC